MEYAKCWIIPDPVIYSHEKLKLRVNIEQWGTTYLGKNLFALPKVQEFPTSVVGTFS